MTYPMRLSPDGTHVAVRTEPHPENPWYVTGGMDCDAYMADADVAGWTPLVPFTPALIEQVGTLLDRTPLPSATRVDLLAEAMALLTAAANPKEGQ